MPEFIEFVRLAKIAIEVAHQVSFAYHKLAKI